MRDGWGAKCDGRHEVSAELGIGLTDVDGLLTASFLEVAGRELTGRDLLAAGVVSERWQQFERELSEGLGLVAAARPADAEITDEVRAFRYERRLLSAEDLRGWMAPRGLTLRAVNEVAGRAVARRHGGAPRTVTAAEVAAALSAEAICTGVLVELGGWLVNRVLSATATDVNIEPIALEGTRIQRLVLAEARTVAGATCRESGLERAQRLAWIAALDDAHRAWEAGVCGTREVTRRLRERELDWCRFELDELRLGSPGAAAEAARQLAEGSNSHQIAAAAGVTLTSDRVILADAPSQLARTLAGAVAGDVVGPWDDGGEHVVVRVRDRRAPDIGDAQLVARARDELLVDATARLRAGKIRWHERA